MAGWLRVPARLLTNLLAGAVLLAAAVLVVGTRGSLAAAELASLPAADVPPIAAEAIERATTERWRGPRVQHRPAPDPDRP
jgi:hypothetical protein